MNKQPQPKTLERRKTLLKEFLAMTLQKTPIGTGRAIDILAEKYDYTFLTVVNYLKSEKAFT